MLKIFLDKSIEKSLLQKHADELLIIVKDNLKSATIPSIKAYFTDATINEILKCEASQLGKLNDKIITDLEATHSVDTIQRELKVIFKYNTFFRKSRKPYNAFNLCAKIGLHTCPYCNVNFITTIFKHGKRGMILRPPLDHFLPFSKYPLLSLSFYNLIPSCWTCNSSFKLAFPTTIEDNLNPYIDGFGSNYKLTFTGYKVIDDVMSKNGTAYALKFAKNTTDIRKDGNIRLFKLLDIYNEHKEVARRTLVTASQYNETTINAISFLAQATKFETYDLIFNSPYDLDSLHLSPFAKLNRDIIEEFGSKELKVLLGLKTI